MVNQLINYSEVEYHTEPWEHIIIRNMFTDGADHISNFNITFGNRNWTDGDAGGKIPIPFWEQQRLGIKKYARAVKSREFSNFIIDKFNDKVVREYGTECDLKSWDDMQTMVEITFINKFSERPSSDDATTDRRKKNVIHGQSLGWHLDMGKKPLTGIMWFREDDDTLEEPGNLVLGNGKEDQKIIPYEKNTGVFWANTPETWHRVTTRELSHNNMRRSMSWSIFTNVRWHDYQHLQDKEGVPVFGYHKVNKWKQSNSN